MLNTARRLAYSSALCLALAGSAHAQESAATPVDEVEPPPPIASGENLEDPEVTIVTTPDETRYEYRVGGVLRGIRVVPAFGPVYYLVDTDGDGDLDRTSNPYDEGLKINSWMLFSW